MHCPFKIKKPPHQAIDLRAPDEFFNNGKED